MKKRFSSVLLGSMEAAATLTFGAIVGCGNVANLGEGTGGQGGHSGGTETNGGSGGQVGTGGAITPIFGGSGGLTTNGGSGAFSDYPHDPTVPIDADCTCTDASSVCNARGDCVPRCDASDVCAVWRVDRAVTAMLADGNDVFLVLAPERDALGNKLPEARSALMKASYPAQAPREIARFDGRLLGRVAGKVYVADDQQQRVFAIDDAGTVKTRELPSRPVAARGDASAVGVGASGLYWSADEGLFRLPLDLTGDPEPLYDAAMAAPPLALVSDKLWFVKDNVLCAADPDNAADMTCLPEGGLSGDAFAAESDDVFILVPGLTGEVRRRSLDGQNRLLYRPRQGRFGLAEYPTLYANSLFYSFAEKSDSGREFIRFPALIAEEPEPVVSDSIANSLYATQQNTRSTANPLFCVGSAGVFMAQRFQDNDTDDASVSRYVFRAPLPTE